jgi:hypothetical protein
MVILQLLEVSSCLVQHIRIYGYFHFFSISVVDSFYWETYFIVNMIS